MAPGSIFKASLSPEQLEVEQRLRTLALMLVGLAVIACGLYYLEGILIPLVLALALTYTLQPMIDLLSKRPLHLCGRKFFAQQPAAIREARPMLRPFYELVYLAKLPWWLATCIAVSVAVLVLVGLGFLVADSVQEFAAEADAYAKRIEDLTAGALNYMDEVSSSFQLYLNVSVVVPANATSVEVSAVSHRKRIEQIAKKIPVTDLITTVLETLFTLMSDLATVLLFAVYLLVGSAPSAADDDFETLPDEVTTAAPDEEARGEQGGASGATPPSGVRKGPRAKKGAASRAIQAYIRAKVSVSFFVGVVTAAALAAIGLELWLVFAILGFWLNFVPVIGTVFAIALPMPIVLLDPDFNLAHVLAPPLPPDEISRDRPRSREANPPSVGARRVPRPRRGARTRGQRARAVPVWKDARLVAGRDPLLADGVGRAVGHHRHGAGGADHRRPPDQARAHRLAHDEVPRRRPRRHLKVAHLRRDRARRRGQREAGWRRRRQ